MTVDTTSLLRLKQLNAIKLYITFEYCRTNTNLLISSVPKLDILFPALYWRLA